MKNFKFIFFISVFSIIITLTGCDKNSPDQPNKSLASLTVTTEDKPEIPEQSLSVVMVGDVLLHTNVTDSGRMEDQSYNYDHLFKNVKEDITSADLAIVNQEVILGGREMGLSGYPAFNGAYEVGDSLVRAGFDIVLHGTNHALDKGKRGIMNCLDFWEKSYPDIAVLGLNKSQNEQDNNIYVYEQNGIKIAILNYTYGTNGIKPPPDMPYIVNYLDEDKIKSDVAKAKALSDFVIVCPHFGTEYINTVSREQKYWIDIFLECGVDLVIGTHPHVIEPVEWVTRDDGHKMLVYYSLGNFINSTEETKGDLANRMVGAMAKVTLSRDEKDEVHIKDYGVEPLVTHLLFGSGLITTYKLYNYTEELAKENKIRLRDPNFSLEYCKNLCREVFGDLYVER